MLLDSLPSAYNKISPMQKEKDGKHQFTFVSVLLQISDLISTMNGNYNFYFNIAFGAKVYEKNFLETIFLFYYLSNNNIHTNLDNFFFIYSRKVSSTQRDNYVISLFENKN